MTVIAHPGTCRGVFAGVPQRASWPQYRHYSRALPRPNANPLDPTGQGGFASCGAPDTDWVT